MRHHIKAQGCSPVALILAVSTFASYMGGITSECTCRSEHCGGAGLPGVQQRPLLESKAGDVLLQTSQIFKEIDEEDESDEDADEEAKEGEAEEEDDVESEDEEEEEERKPEPIPEPADEEAKEGEAEEEDDVESEDEEEEEERKPEPIPEPSPAPVPAPEPEPDVESEDEGEAEDEDHWDWLDEEHAEHDLNTDEHLGGIQDIIKNAVKEIIEPLGSKLTQMTDKMTQMENGMEEAHNREALTKVQEVVAPLKEQLEAIDSKVDSAHASREDMAANVQGVAANLKKLDGLDDAVKNAATSDELQGIKTDITNSVEEYEKVSAQALGKVNSAARANSKILKKLFDDLHGR